MTCQRLNPGGPGQEEPGGRLELGGLGRGVSMYGKGEGGGGKEDRGSTCRVCQIHEGQGLQLYRTRTTADLC